MAGFVACGCMVYRSINDWRENPVLTTLDTIVAPIEDIQFPTVTVCPDESQKPDNWAPIETILNQGSIDLLSHFTKVKCDQ